MNGWLLLFLGTIVAVSALKVVVSLRTGEIGMFTSYGAGRTYRRSDEPFRFYRAVVIQGLATILLGAVAYAAASGPN